MTRVVVHAGFHKTGTTSVQKYLGAHSTALAPYFAFYGQGDALHRSAVAARVFAKKPFFWRKRALRAALRADFAALPEAEVFVLSREHFSGVMPGLKDWRGRPVRRFSRAARPIAKAIVAELRHRFGPDVEITFFYTTRDRDPWLASVHGHLLRSTDLTDDLDGFKAGFAPDLSPATEAQIMARALAPIPVETAALEDWSDAHAGPAGALLDLLNLPRDLRDALPPARVENQGHDPKTRDAMRALNRSKTDPSRLKREKDALIHKIIN